MLSHIGDDMQLVAVSWLVLVLTDSPFLMGVATITQGLPRLFFGLLGGVLADLKNRHRLLMIYQACEMVLAFLFAALVFTGRIQYWQILVLLPVIGFFKSVYNIGRQAYMFDLVGREELMNALALHSTGMNLAKIIGPSIAGIIIGVWGVGWCLLLNGLSFIAILTSFMLMKPPPAKERPQRRSNMLQSLGEAFVFLKGNPPILLLILASFSYMMFGMQTQVIMPLFARDVLKAGASGFGFLMAAMGVGAVIGGVIIASLGDLKAKGRFYLLSALCYAVLLILFSLSSWFYFSLFLIFLVGIVDLFSKTINQTLVQLLAPDELRGRILGVFMLDRGMRPLGGFMLGAVASLLGAPLALGMGAGVCMAVTLSLLLKAPRLRQL
jgi:MFS family permease